MINVFSFVIYGNEKKYTNGLLENIQLIGVKFPSWNIWIYYGSDVNESTLSLYREYKNVKLIPTNVTGYITKFYRYFAIDDESVGICIVRDADSRVNNRDEICINEFLKSDKDFHIIRDHPNHKHVIMAGMWGIKKGALYKPIHKLFSDWIKTHAIDFWSDTHFLTDYIYPICVSTALIHDDLNHFNDSAKPIPHIRDGNHFIGQVYEYDKDGLEYAKFDY